ncbi:MAG: glycosyltransferase [Chitinispirillaceae bacterium]
MNNLKIVHLFNLNRGSRYPSMISQGLWTHPRISVSFSMPFISLGSLIQPADPNLEKSLITADYIFRANDEHFGIQDMDAILDRHDLWKKVIYYDFKDNHAIDTHRLATCAAYIKRSWPIGYDRRARPATQKPILPMDYGLLDEYFAVNIPDEKDIDVACLFPSNPIIGTRRYQLITILKRCKSWFPDSHIGMPTAAAATGRRAVFASQENNPFLDYLSVLKRSKIVFTAYPDNHDGDSRTWEAFSSQALVFMDKTSIPSPHPFVNGRDCFIYDARDPESIMSAVIRARAFLRNESHRRAIALQGYKHALTYHKPVDRINLVLQWIRSTRAYDETGCYAPAAEAERAKR